MRNLVLAALGVAALSASAFVSTPALADDALIAKGEAEMKKCYTCHRVEDADGNIIGKSKKIKTGPNLYGLPGRKAGALETYARSNGKTKFGKSLVAAGEKGLVWTAEDLAKYIVDPKGYLSEYLGDKAKSKMAAQKKSDGLAIYAYLESISPKAE